MNSTQVLTAEQSAATLVSSTSTKKRWGAMAVKGVISCGLMYWVLQGTDLSAIMASIRGADLLAVWGAFLLSFVGYGISVSRWKILLDAQGVGANTMFLVKSFLVSIFFNNLLPSTVGGDVVRAYDSWRLGASKAKAAAVIFLDRFLGVLALMSLACLGLAMAPRVLEHGQSLQGWILCGIGLTGILVWNIFFSSRGLFSFLEKVSSFSPAAVRTVIAKIIEAFRCFQGRRDTLIQGLALSLLLQTNVVLQYFMIAHSLHLAVSIGAFFVVIPVALFLMLLPVSINGIGIRETVFILLLNPLGVGKAESLALAWLAYGFIILQGILGGVVYATRK